MNAVRNMMVVKTRVLIPTEAMLVPVLQAIIQDTKEIVMVRTVKTHLLNFFTPKRFQTITIN